MTDPIFSNEHTNTLIGSFKLEDGRVLSATFANVNDKDGFEISLGMYRVNLGPVDEAIFDRYMNKFGGQRVRPGDMVE